MLIAPMHPRKIVNTAAIQALDCRLPPEITDMVLPHLLEHGRKVAVAFTDIVGEMYWEKYPIDRAGHVVYKSDYLLSCTVYKNGVDKEVYRCDQCTAVQKIRWTFSVMDGIEQEFDDESIELKYRACTGLDHRGSQRAVLLDDLIEGGVLMHGRAKNVNAKIGTHGVRLTLIGQRHEIAERDTTRKFLAAALLRDQ